MTSRRRLPLAIPLIILVLARCSHGDAYAPETFPADTTFGGGSRLTLNPNVDRDPTWLPDGSGILYSADLVVRGDSDRCLVTLPPSGGRIIRTVCNDLWTAGDSVNTLDDAALSAGGLMALVRTSRPVGGRFVRYADLAAGTPGDPAQARALMKLPYSAAGLVHNSVSQIRWLAPDTLIYRGDYAALTCLTATAPCPQAFVVSGYDIEIHSASDSGPPTVVPGTDLASSVALDPGGDAFFYTLQADNRIYRRVLSTGATTVVYSFPAGTIVRDVHAVGSLLAAITGGQVVILAPPVTPDGTPPLQYDPVGGDITVLNLATGTPLAVIAGQFRRPALSPDGRHIVAQSAGDLYLFNVP